MHIESYVLKVIFSYKKIFFVFQRTNNALRERLLNDLVEDERQNLMEQARRDLKKTLAK